MIFQKFKILLISCLFIVAAFLRLYNFENRINFGPEQAVSLITSAGYIEKPSLLGLPSVRRVTSLGHTIFFEPLFTYSLVPLLLLFKYNPVPTTFAFVLINLLTAAILYLTVKKIFNFAIAFFSTFLFLFSSVMINHSLFIWINHSLLLANAAILYFFWKYKKDNSILPVFVIGILAGISVGVQYMYLLTGVPFVALAVIKLARNRFRDIAALSLGFALASLPTIIFDIKHDFYHVRTLWQYLLDALNNPGISNFDYYHLLHFWPLLFIIGGMAVYLLYKQNRKLAFLILAVYLIFNLRSNLVSFTGAVGMPEGLNYPAVNRAAQIISNDQPDQFNVATTYDFDSRAHPLRYLLEFRYNKTPGGVTEYPQNENLYVLSVRDYDFTDAPWEISSFNPQDIVVLSVINEDYSLYKLTK